MPRRAEIGESQAGNYLAALVAGADRDTTAAAVYFREALRADPQKSRSVERAFAAALADGRHRRRLSARRSPDRRGTPATVWRVWLWRCARFREGQFVAARAQLAAGEAGKAHDVTTTLLTAWSYAGAGDLRRALETLDRVRDPSVAVFRDYHAGLIADLLGNAPRGAAPFEGRL